MGALRRELSAQGALIAEDDYFKATLPVNFAEDAERIHAQCVQTADSWRIFPKAVTGSLEVLADEPQVTEPVTLDFGTTEPLTIEPVHPHDWHAFLDFLRGCAEHGLVVA